jgi:hypothetical protein
MRADVLTQIHERVNTQLLLEHIPEVAYDVFEWRIARAIQYRTAGKRAVPEHQEYLLTLIAKEKHKDGAGLEPASGSN